jgi:hypothetical protein
LAPGGQLHPWGLKFSPGVKLRMGLRKKRKIHKVIATISFVHKNNKKTDPVRMNEALMFIPFYFGRATTKYDIIYRIDK